MNLLAIAWKSIRQRRLASCLTALSIGLGVMLMVLVLVIFGAVDGAFNQRSVGYDLIVGPQRGSELQLVLSAVYRMQPPSENLPYMFYEDLKKDRRVVSAVPLAFGDSTQQGGFPIVGTTSEYFENEYMPGHKFRIRGNRINGLFDTIIGHEVARQNQWDVGSTFQIVHGGADSEALHEETFTVVAVLAQTGTANDRTVFLNIEGFYAIDGHEKPVEEVEERMKKFYAANPERLAEAMTQLDGVKSGQLAAAGTESPRVMKEVTAILVRTRPAKEHPFDSMQMSSEFQKGYQAMAVNPIRPIQRLMQSLLGNIMKALVVLTGVIILVSGIGIFVSIYNSMSDRRREIGIMRALGAQRMHVFGIILAESSLLCIGGGVMGWLAGHGMAIGAAPWVIQQTGLLINPWSLNVWEAVLFPVLVGVAVLVGFLPAMTAYRTNVADALSS
jgi:putative ABC transport system permease protein